MEDNIPQKDEESSLVEIEVAEEEEIEVEESETETENMRSISNNPQGNISYINLDKNNIKNSKDKLPNLNQEQNINDNIDNNSKMEEMKNEKENINLDQDKSIDKSIEKNDDKPYSELELKIIDIMGGSEKINNLLNNNNKWDEKKKGFMLLNEFISNSSNKEKIIINFEIFFNYIQDILKNFKESNFIILKEGIICIWSLFNIIKKNKIDYNSINKKYLNILITELNEKITENKLKSIYIKLLNILFDIYTPNEVMNNLIQTINKNNKISILKEYAIFIKDYINSNSSNIKFLNIKEIIDFCIKLGNNNNPQLRSLSSDIISNLYNYIGDEYIIYIKNNIKESAFKNIEQKIKYIKNAKSQDNIDNPIDNQNNIKKSNEINLEKNNIKSNNINNNIEKGIKNKNRVDISKDITPLLLKYINYGKWNEKKEGIEYIHKILNENNSHILINGLQDLIELVIEKLSDSNKNLVKLIIELLSHLIESLETQLKPYSKNIINQLLSNLSDKNNILRNECILCINKWISIIQNFETIFILIPSFLLNDNYEMRSELLNLLLSNVNIILNDNYYKNHFEDLINSLLYCLQDKSSNIRNSTEQFIRLCIKIIPREYYIKNTNKFKPSIKEGLSNIINNIYGYHDEILENRENRGISRERNFSTKRHNKFFSPKKLLINDGEDDVTFTRRDILSREKLSKSIDKDIKKNSFCAPEEKDNKHSTVINEKKKKKIFPNKTCTTANFTKKNKESFSSFNNTLENFHKKNKKIKIDKGNLNNNKINNSSINNSLSNSSFNNNINNSSLIISTNNKINKKNKNKISPIKEKNQNQNQDMENIATIAKRVNKFFKNSNKTRRIPSKKHIINNKNKPKDKQTISNYKNNFKQIMEEIRNEDNSKVPQRNRFFSPALPRRGDLNTTEKHKVTKDNFNNSINLFSKKMNNLSNKNGNSELMTHMSTSISKIEVHIKGNLFLSSFKIKKENKDKRIDEDRKINYCFEIQNFEKIPKIKEIMKNIFSNDFVEKIFSDNIPSIIACIEKLKKYIEKDKKDSFLNIENNLDLILKVLGYKLTNNKSSSLVIAMFEFCNSLLLYYKKYKLFFNEIEANILLNIFVDKLINNSNIIRDLDNNLIWMVVDIIGEEMGLLIIMHLIEYKNSKTKIETINIIIQLYKILLGKGIFNFDNWKIKIIKNIINLYFEGDHNNKNKLLFIIQDLYSSFKNEIWKFCKNISSKDKDELLNKIQDNQINSKYNFDNEYQSKTITNTHLKPKSNLLFNTANKIQEENDIQNNKPKTNTTRMKDEFKINKIKKIKTKVVYTKKNKKVFENRKNIKLQEEDDINNNYQIHSNQNSNLTEVKKSNLKSNLKLNNKNIRDSSIKKKLFLKHINTTQNIHNNQNYENIINQATNKLVLLNNNKQLDKNQLSQSTVIINNNYNFIKIKNNEIQNKRETSINNKNLQNKNIINNNPNVSNVDNLNNKNNSINIIHSNLNNENSKMKIFVNTNKKEKFNEIKKILESLCSTEKTDMTELILKIHNILYTNYKKNESILITHCDYIFNKLIVAINNLLDEKKIYTNYIKYISNILCKICKLGDLVSRINLDTQNNLIILTVKTVSLLNDNNQNDKNYYYNNSNEENSVIIKCFNSIMLRIIDYGDINNNISIFMNFEKKYRKISKDVVSYVAKCLIIIIKTIKKTYEKIDIGNVIDNIYKLLEDISINNLNIKIDNRIDQIIMITIKNFLSQLILFRGDKILIDYINSKYKDNNVKFWLLQYIQRIKNHRNKINEKNDNLEENNINNENDN